MINQNVIKADLEKLLSTVQLTDWGEAESQKAAAKIQAGKASYWTVQSLTRIPWWFIGGLHHMESGCDFSTHLANGDPLSARTVQVPVGLPREGNPPFSWIEGAVAALKDKNWVYSKTINWADPIDCLYHAEVYNGFGYRISHPDCKTPYLWSGTNHYKTGKYIGDGAWSPTAVSKQIGIMPIWQALKIDLSPLTNPMADQIRSTFLSDASKYDNGQLHQIAAWEWLQTKIDADVLAEFKKRFSPDAEVLPTPVADKYQLLFTMACSESSDLLVGTLEFQRNSKTYNTIRCTSSLPGLQYKGAWNKRGGLLPPSTMVRARCGVGWTVNTSPIYMPNVTGVSGNFYQISPFEVQTDGKLRGDFGIHRDANVPGCLSADDTQVLTPDGWKYGKDLTVRDFVAQMNTLGEIVYGKPARIVLESYKGLMVSITSNKLNMLVTPNHRVLTASRNLGKRTESYKSSIQYHRADSLTNDREIGIPISFIDRHNGETWDKAKAQLFIAYLADGYHQDNQTAFRFKRARKIERLESILSAAQVSVKKFDRTNDTIELKIPRLDYVEKDIDPTLALNLSYQTRVDMLSELIHWDGTSGNNTNKNSGKYSVVICSTNKTHHDFYELLAITSGYSFTSNLYLDKRGEDWKPLYRMSIVENRRIYKLTPKSQEGSLEISNVDYDGLVFCLETETSNFIVKHQDKIFATGNSMGCLVATTEAGWTAAQREFTQLAGLGIRAVDLLVKYS